MLACQQADTGRRPVLSPPTGLAGRPPRRLQFLRRRGRWAARRWANLTCRQRLRPGPCFSVDGVLLQSRFGRASDRDAPAAAGRPLGRRGAASGRSPASSRRLCRAHSSVIAGGPDHAAAATIGTVAKASRGRSSCESRSSRGALTPRTPGCGRKHEQRTTRRGRDPDARFSAKRSRARDSAAVGTPAGGVRRVLPRDCASQGRRSHGS